MDVEKQFKIKISKNRLCFAVILASFSSQKRKRVNVLESGVNLYNSNILITDSVKSFDASNCIN